MTMTRQELDEHLVDYLFDELSEEEATRFEAAVVDYPELQAEVSAHQQTRQRAAALPQREMSPSVMAAVMNEARSAVSTIEEKPGWFESLIATLMQPAMVTVMLVVVVAGASVFVVQQEDGALGEVSVASSTLASDTDLPEPSGPSPASALAEERVVATSASPASSRPAPAGLEAASGQVPTGDGALRPVSPAVSRLVEVEPQVAEVSTPPSIAAKKRGAKAKKRSKRSRRDGGAFGAPDSVQVARAEPLPQPRSAPVFAKRSMKKLPPKAAAASAPTKHPIQMARLSEPYAADEAAALEKAPSPPATAEGDRAAYERVAEPNRSQSDVKKEVDLRARGKRLVTEFEKHLKTGDSAKAASALEKLAKIPGFESATKRKRKQLRAWLKTRELKRAKKKGKSK